MTVVVAGGNRGIGFEMARGLTQPGETVILGYQRDEASAREAVETLAKDGITAFAVQSDMSTPEGVAHFISEAARLGDGSIRVLVHSLVRVLQGPILEHDVHEITSVLNVNAMSLLWLVHAARPNLDRGSCILFLSSRGSTRVIPGYGAVGPAKAFAESLIKNLAVELGPDGIRINAISPGTQDTQALRQVYGDKTDEKIEASRKATPMRRLATPKDYVALSRFIVSPEAEMLTGQTYMVYGGTDLI